MLDIQHSTFNISPFNIVTLAAAEPSYRIPARVMHRMTAKT